MVFTQKDAPFIRSHASVTFATDEQKVTVGSERFIAVDRAAPGSCKGCEMVNGFGCALTRSDATARCRSAHRQDAREVVWHRDLPRRH